MQHPRQLHHGLDARTRLIRGARTLTRAVLATYGPLGRLVFLQRLQGLIVTKDGVTVAREISLPDPVENMGAQMVRDACLAANSSVGDGTTSTAVLVDALLVHGQRALVGGADPQRLAQGLRAAAVAAVEAVQYLSSAVDSEDVLRHVARVASNGDEEVARALAEAALAVGKDGVILIEDGRKVEVEVEYKEGMEIPSGMLSLLLVNDNDKMSLHREDVLVAVSATPLTTVADVVSLMEEASTFRIAGGDPDPLVILAPWIEGPALETILLNCSGLSSRLRHSNHPPYIPINAPGTRAQKIELLRDIAALAGATFVDPAAGMDVRQFDRSWFGSFREVTQDQKRSILLAYDEGSCVETKTQRIRVLRAMAHVATSDYDKDQLQQRLGALSGGVCVIRVGGVTEAAMKERRARIEDALSSVQAALGGGVVPGGGTIYLAASERVRELSRDVQDPDVRQGWLVLSRALRAPVYRLAETVPGASPGSVVEAVIQGRLTRGTFSWFGWDCITEQCRDLREGDLVLDPARVVESAIQTAAAVGALILTVEVSITLER